MLTAGSWIAKDAFAAVWLDAPALSLTPSRERLRSLNQQLLRVLVFSLNVVAIAEFFHANGPFSFSINVGFLC
jgi:hypothetical protein